MSDPTGDQAERRERLERLGGLREKFESRVVGLEGPRRRVLERLALVGLTGRPVGPAMLLSGPEGSGKRTLIDAAAAATGRAVVRLNLADGADVEAKAAAPLLVLERIDLARSASAVLALLDPARAGDALVVATARHPALIPDALHAHLEAIRLPGYSRDEKVELARRSLLPRALEASGIAPGTVEVTAEALAKLAASYSPEPGVAQLARRIGEVVRRAAGSVALGDARAARVGPDEVAALLGPPPAPPLPPRVRAEVGVVTGIVWGEAGAEVALVEALRGEFSDFVATHVAPSRSARMGSGFAGAARAAVDAAVAFVRQRADQLRIEPESISAREVCLRVIGPPPAGDEDGLDLAVLLALVSLASDRPIRPDVAATGALSLRGAVRPVAGVPEKVLAAARAGARKVLIPAADLAALEAALSPAALASINVVPVSSADEAVREALIDIVIPRELK